MGTVAACMPPAPCAHHSPAPHPFPFFNKYLLSICCVGCGVLEWSHPSSSRSRHGTCIGDLGVGGPNPPPTRTPNVLALGPWGT